MSARREEGGQPKTDSCGQGRREGISQMWMSALKEKWFSFFLIIIFWKYFLSNINLIFEYRVPDKIMLDCKVYSSSLHIHTHTPFAYIISLPQKQKLLSNLSAYLYLLGCQLEWTPQNIPLVCCLSIYWNYTALIMQF